MYKIGVVGSGPDRFGEPEAVQRTIGSTIDLLLAQYGQEEAVFGIEAAIGVGLWAGQVCMLRESKYHLYLPYTLEKTSEHWFPEQQEMLRAQYTNMYSLTICNKELVHESLVDSSNFIVCFWAGNKNGKTFRAIKHALKKNKIVLDAFNDLKLITNADLRKNGHGRKTRTY